MKPCHVNHKMIKILKKVITFAIAFGIIVLIIPKQEMTALDTNQTTDPIFLDAIENIKFYSSYNYQTLTQDKLDKINTDFYLPTSYQGIDITYIIDSEYLELSTNPEIISLREGTGFIDVEVVKVTVISLPNILKGEQSFVIFATSKL